MIKIHQNRTNICSRHDIAEILKSVPQCIFVCFFVVAIIKEKQKILHYRNKTKIESKRI
jgi:hypothetical protein